MAYADSLVTIRDNLVAELQGETARRKALVEAGHPPPATYSAGGRSLDWNGYLRMMVDEIERINAQVIRAGGDGGLIDEQVQGWPG
jgi:hypothetical protein